MEGVMERGAERLAAATHGAARLPRLFHYALRVTHYAAIVVASLLLVPGAALATDDTWTSGVSGSWAPGVTRQAMWMLGLVRLMTALSRVSKSRPKSPSIGLSDGSSWQARVTR